MKRTSAAAAQQGHIRREAAEEAPFTACRQQRHRVHEALPQPSGMQTHLVSCRQIQAKSRHTSVLGWGRARHISSVFLKYIKGKIMQKQPVV